MPGFEPHPYALLLPPLNPDEYAALKTNVERFGILHAVITDDAGRVLDGIHRCRIATELGIDAPVSRMGQLSEQEKLQLAVGINVRRRQLDADRRRELVLKLRDEQGLSVREIAAVTGWSKSTVGRDLTPPDPAPPTTDGVADVDEVMRRWELEHPEPRPADYYADDGDHLGAAAYHLARIDHERDRSIFLYGKALEHAAELVADPTGAAHVTLAAAGIRFHTADRKAEQEGSTPEDFTEAQQAWVAFVAAKDAVAALNGEPTGGDRKASFHDFLYHPAFQEWRDEADEDAVAVPDGTGA